MRTKNFLLKLSLTVPLSLFLFLGYGGVCSKSSNDGDGSGSKKNPIVVTKPASSITSFSAILNATVNANGLDTTPVFEYGPTTSYGYTASPPTIITGATDTQVYTVVTGLSPATLYHFRIKGTNSDGISLGLDEVFTTLP